MGRTRQLNKNTHSKESTGIRHKPASLEDAVAQEPNLQEPSVANHSASDPGQSDVVQGVLTQQPTVLPAVVEDVPLEPTASDAVASVQASSSLTAASTNAPGGVTSGFVYPTVRAYYSGGGTGVGQGGSVSPTTLVNGGAVSSGNQSIDNLLGTYSFKWGGDFGTPVHLTYSFSKATSSYGGHPLSVMSDGSSALVEFTEEQKQAARQAMAMYAAVANITFTEVPDTGTTAGDIRWTATKKLSNIAEARVPSYDAISGDLFFSADSRYLNPATSSEAFRGFIHELGHVLGMYHPHTSPDPVVPGEETLKHSVMSYFETLIYGFSASSDFKPRTPMINDVLTMQYLYGANTSWNAGNNVYQWNPGSVVFETIWDGGGIDTLDASNQAAPVLLNLNPGQWSQIGALVAKTGYGYVNDNLTIAYNVDIEHAVGSAHADTLIGNALGNRLAGQAGNDTMDGGAGLDTLVGGNGADTYFLDNGPLDVLEEDGTDGARDTIIARGLSALDLTGYAAVENLRFESGTAGVQWTGNALDNELVGSGFQDTLTGGSGNDTLDGAGGADSLVGGQGGDTYVLDNIGDVVDETGTDTLVDKIITKGLTSLDLQSSASLQRVEHLEFAQGASGVVFAGNGLNNTLRGSAYRDTLSGGAGDDVLISAGGDDRLTGGFGNDLYVVDDEKVQITELSGQGRDRVESSVSMALADHVEDLTLTGASAAFGGGNALQNLIVGNDGGNLLDGGAGDGQLDTLRGGMGGDTYNLDMALIDVVDEQGTDSAPDTIQIRGASGAFTLASYGNVENLFAVAGSQAVQFTGNALNNRLYGSAYADLLEGGAGNDTLLGYEGADTLRGGTGADVYMIMSADATVEESSGDAGQRDGVEMNGLTVFNLGSSAGLQQIEDIRVGFSSSGVDLTGNSLANRVEGSSFNDVLNGAQGTDTLMGSGGNDVLIGGAAGTYEGNTYEFHRNFGQDTVYATGSDVLDFLSGQISPYEVGLSRQNNDLQVNLLGASPSSALVKDYFASANARVQRIRLHVGSSPLDNDWLGETEISQRANGSLVSGAGALSGTVGGDTLQGSDGDDTLTGGEGADQLLGGLGNDQYVVDHLGDTVVEALDGGIDKVVTNALPSYQLGADVEHLDMRGVMYLLPGQTFVSAQGNALANDITGSQWLASQLVGGDGQDTLRANVNASTTALDTVMGGLGDDTYYISGYDVVTEQAGEGIDSVYVLGSQGKRDVDIAISMPNVENISFAGFTGNLLQINGSGADNRIEGNDEFNAIYGLAGADELLGGGNIDNLYGGAGNDTLRGGTENDTLSGDADDDWLDGESGTDIMAGGAGNDTYKVDQLLDKVNEFTAGEAGGVDTIWALVDYTLPTNVEELRLEGTANLQAWSNVAGGNLYGNAGNNILTGRDGQDNLDGGDGADSLYGWGGSDLLVGGSGLDRLEGGLGDDTYNLMHPGAGGGGDPATTAVDEVIEAAGGGVDTVITDIWTYYLPEQVENLYMGGKGGYDYSLGAKDGTKHGYGNDLSNSIVGRSGIDVLSGLAGRDTLSAGAGNDSLNGGIGNDSLEGGAGDDTYVWMLGDGADIINDTEGADDSVQFQGNIAADQLWFQQVGQNLQVSIIGTQDKLTLQGWYQSTSQQIERFELADGRGLQNTQVQALVEAMLQVSVPAQTSLPTTAAYDNVRALISSAWT